MNEKTISLIVATVLIVGIGSYVYWQKDATINSNGTEEQTDSQNTNSDTNIDSSNNNTDASTDTITPTNSTPSGITMNEVATHKSSASCWSVINGSVYDLTGWIPNHPGGPQRILQICGIDGSAKFNGQHGGSSKVLKILAGFKIGTVSN